MTANPPFEKLRQRRNPYVGPRPFRQEEQLPARHREKHELADILIAERIVLLHSPSGAGKTSLIQAGVSPILKDEGFYPTPPLRVSTPPPESLPVLNKYVYSVALGVLANGAEPEEAAGLSMSDLVERVTERAAGLIPVLVFDQFEEIVTIDPIDWETQEGFFEQLGSALAKNQAWALLSIREDYIGGLDRFVRYIPSHLRTTYRLDFLDVAGAKQAIQDLAASQGVAFADEAAVSLLDKLRTVRIQRPGREAPDLFEAPYVEPFQLQVTCRKLWKSVRRAKGDDFGAIDAADVERYVDVAGALRGYFADTVSDVAKTTGVEEFAIRDWFERQLITEQHFRSQTMSGPASGDVEPRAVLQALEDGYLVRGDTRAHATWYELTHDQLIEPILEDNDYWRRGRLESWQLVARQWSVTHEGSLLLRGKALREASQRAASGLLSEVERTFLEDSARTERERGLLDRTKYALSWMALVAMAELAVIIILLLLRTSWL